MIAQSVTKWMPPALITLGGSMILCVLLFPFQQDRLLRRAATALACERYAEAEDLANTALWYDPDSTHALAIAGEAAAKQKHDAKAVEYLRRVDGSQQGIDALHARYRRGERLMVMGYASLAEADLREVLNRDPTHIEANRKLSKLLQVQGRTWESLPLVETLVLGGKIRKSNLLTLGDIEKSVAHDDQFLRNCQLREPDNSLVMLGAIRVALRNQHDRQSEAVLRKIVLAQPEIAEGQVQLGKLLWERGSEQQFLDWQVKLDKSANDHPEIWFLRGLWARSRGHNRAAIRCFLETAERHPNHSGAGFQLSQLMRDTEQHEIAVRLAQRSKLRGQVEYLISELRRSYDSGYMKKVVALLKSLQQPLEAAAWCHVAWLYDQSEEWAVDELRELRLVASASRSVTSAQNHPLKNIDKFAFPLPNWPDVGTKEEAVDDRQRVDGEIFYADVAPEVGLHFDYYNGTTETTGLVHILQATGGGIGVIDFDQDGWPDIYFAQSGPFPVDSSQVTYRDRLFRNLGNGKFEDVTVAAGLGDPSFSQGVSVGDINSDGFPELYVANVYGNRLYWSNGDGTFEDVTESTGIAGDKWTTSCMIADLNGDALPDLYEVNYALMSEVLEIVCKHEGQPMSCTPTMYTAEQDRFHLNLGDGTFHDATESSGIVASDGKGLGIVAADFDGNQTLDIFVGNDTTANFYFVNRSQSPANLDFQEQGVLVGLGFDSLGLFQACMGLAVDDLDGDGLLDIFVTNFYDESNTLYLQDRKHSFADQTRATGLREPSISKLGFGSQTVDADLDGWRDLVVANGHVDRSFATGVADKMPPQFFRNTGAGKFEELSGTSLGAYFQGKYLGRTVATLDWNRDGREDFCVSHLDMAAALLSNQSQTTGHFLAVRLRGVHSNRDAIGTTVRVHLGDRELTRQLVGGNGYLASNQKQLVFGLGDTTLIDKVTVVWPSGAEQSFMQLAADREILLIEGVDAEVVLSR